MLDETKPEVEEVATGVEPELTPEAAPEVAAEPEAEGEIVISIEGETPEVDEDAEAEAELGEKGLHALRAARAAAKEAKREAREAKAELAKREAQAAPQQADEIGPRPTLADAGWNEDNYALVLLDWNKRKEQADAKKTAAEAEAKARETAYGEKLTRYNAERSRVGVDDEVQAIVVAALTPQQQAALMDASIDPAKVVAALAKTPKVLAELAGIKEIHKFTYRLAQVEGKIQMTTKAPPPPEKRLTGGVATAGGTLKAQLDAAEKRFETNGGDRTDILRIKRAMRDAGMS